MNLRNSPNINYLWGALIVEELIRNGVEYFCLSPGSRSSPLAVAVGLNRSAKSCVHYDERAAAFHALGYVSATGAPAALISTSGTAAANFLPAIIETSKKKLPLIVLTADRPPELRRSGADQTIEQVGLFGEYVRWEFDLPCPDRGIAPEVVLTTVDQAVHRAFGSPRGPVHINCMFREPLAPVADKTDFRNYFAGISRWEKTKNPYTTYMATSPRLDEAAVSPIAESLNAVTKGVIVVGKLSGERQHNAVLETAEKLNWPVFPDITSGLRLGHHHKNVIPYFDQILLSETFCKKERPDGVLHIGGRITSKRWYQYLEQNRPRHYLMVNNHPLRNDPLHNVTLRIESDTAGFANAVLPQLQDRKPDAWLGRLQKASETVATVVDKFCNAHQELNEITAARTISECIPSRTGLFLASSMPVREMDMYAAVTPGKKDVTVGSNRGASGIDGTIATASGFVTGTKRPVTLLLGDLAFLHDLNSLGLLRRVPAPVVTVVFNNDGGGIFSFLPIAKFETTFEKFFGTPHGLRFRHAAKLFNLNYEEPKNPASLKRAYLKALKANKSTVLEIRSSRKANLTLHRQLQQKIGRAVDKLFQK